MGDAFRGLTIRLGADARPLNSAISSISRSASQAQKQLNAMNKALKFDNTNVAALSARIGLVGDKALLAARSVRDIKTAMSQVSESTKRFADSTQNIYAETQKVRAEYNHVDASLQHVYDDVRKIVAAEKGWKQDSEELDKYMKKLKSNYGGTTEEAKKLTVAMQAYIRMAHQQFGTGDPFGLRKTFGDSKKLVTIVEELRERQRALNEEIKGANAAEGYRAMKTQLIAWEAELRQAATEAARFKSELYSMAATPRMASLRADLQGADAALEKASASAREMASVFKAMPKSMEAAKAQVASMTAEENILNSKLRTTEAILREIEKTPGFDKLAASTTDVWAGVERAEKQLADLDIEMKKLIADGERFKVAYQDAMLGKSNKTDEELIEIYHQINKNREAVERYRDAITAADKRLESANMQKDWREGREEILKTTAAVEKLHAAMSKMSHVGEIFRSIRTMGYGLYSTVTPALMIAGRYAIQAADDFDAAYRDMRKTVNGTEEQFESLKQQAIEFSTTHVTSAETIMEIESLGGQLGIASENLQGFSEVVSNLDIATNINAEDLATYVGQLSNIMSDIKKHKDDPAAYQDAITSFSDALVRLGNNSAAQESNIMKVMMRIASLGNISGFTTPQLLAISTAVAATGQGCEAAGTAIARTFSNIEAAVGAGGDSLAAFAEVAGMSAEDFAKAWNTNPIEAFHAFIAGLKKIDETGGSVDNTLASLKINSVRQKQALEGLTNTLDVLDDALMMSQDAWDGTYSVINGKVEKAGDAAREAQRKSEGFSGALEMMKNNATALAIELSDGILPLVQALGSAFHGLTDAIRQAPTWLKSFIVIVGSAVAAVGPFAVAIGAVGTAISNIKKMAESATAIKLLSSAASGASTSMTSLAAAALGLESVPFVAVAAGIAAVAGALLTCGLYIKDVNTRTAEFKRATEGLVAEAFLAKTSFNVLNSGIDGTKASLEAAIAGMGDYEAAADELRKKGAALADSWKQQKKEADVSAETIKFYSDRVLELANNCEGSPGKIQALKEALATYNELTGSNYSITDWFTGALDVQTEAFEANTAAARENAYVKAYSNMLKEAVEYNAELTLEYNSQSQKIADLRKGMKELEDTGRDVTGEFDELGNAIKSDEYIAAESALSELTNTHKELGKEIDSSQEAVDRWEEKLEEMQSAMDSSSNAADMLRWDIRDYQKALEDAGKSTDIYSDAANSAGVSLERFARVLSAANISTSDFVRMGTAGFDNLLAVAGGDLEQLGLAVEALNALNLDPLDLTVNADGLAETEAGIIRLDAEAGRIFYGERIFRVTDDGSIQEVTEDLEELEGEADDAAASADGVTNAVNGIPAGKTTYIDAVDNASWKLDNIVSKLYQIAAGATAHIAVDVISSALRASGGFTKLHARGGFVTNGPISLGRDKYGIEHIAGEDGREWIKRHADGTTSIVPIENRRYLKPYAREIAGMIGGGTNNYYITLDYKAGDDAIALARGVQRELETIMNMEA